MKKQFNLIAGTIAIILIVCACNKKTESTVPLTNQVQSTQDLETNVNMNSQTVLMQNALDSMLATPQSNRQQHWDSMYHHHDSIYWHHHAIYSHGNTHDDHTHSFIPYHHHPDYHQQHHFPQHETDSLITTHGIHHHDSTNFHHHNGHDMGHHNTLDSLNKIHETHHP